MLPTLYTREGDRGRRDSTDLGRSAGQYDRWLRRGDGPAAPHKQCITNSAQRKTSHGFSFLLCYEPQKGEVTSSRLSWWPSRTY